jgi:threonine synthase
MGLEMVQQLGWKMPDAVIYPTGGGTGIIGMYKGFQELLELGWIEGKQPKFISVQADGCQPVVRAFNEGADTSRMWENATTKADGLRVPHPFADYLILEAIRATGGTALAVSDQEMIDAMYEMATAEGIFPAPEGAATLVCLKKLLDQKFLDPDESVVLFNTGSGYKYLDLISGVKRD